MKRLIIAILLFVIGCIIIGVIKQEYLIHKLLSQLSFNDSEVILIWKIQLQIVHLIHNLP